MNTKAMFGVLSFVAILLPALALSTGTSMAMGHGQAAAPQQTHAEKTGNEPSLPQAPLDCGITYGTWTAEPSLPQPRHTAMSAVINGKLYVIGGYDSSYAPTTSLYRYDPASPGSGWFPLARMPIITISTQAAAIGTRIYLPGGYDISGLTGLMQIYTAGANVWSQGAELPVARGGVAAAAYNGKVYIFGGSGADNEPSNAMYEYDPVANSYTARRPMPGPAYNASAVVQNNRIFVIGGSGFYYAHYVYSPDQDQWLAIAPSMRSDLDKPGLLNFGGEIWAFAGSYAQPPTPATTVQIYHVETNSWRYGPSYLTQRNYTTAVGLVNNRAYVAGGIVGGVGGVASSAFESIPANGTPCPPPSCNISYPDVPAGDPFYPFVRCLSCKNALGGYGDGTFGTGNPITRGQLAKVVSNSAGYSEDPGGPRFADVPATGLGSTFYPFINRLAARLIVSGYTCGGAGEPCGIANLPYFRPNNNASRGQIAKIVVQASPLSSLPEDRLRPGEASEKASENRPAPQQPIFADVPETSPFYVGVQKLARFYIIGGYSCGGSGEPCTQDAKPYFRPGSNATRGQVAKIVANTFFPVCYTP